MIDMLTMTHQSKDHELEKREAYESFEGYWIRLSDESVVAETARIAYSPESV